MTPRVKKPIGFLILAPALVLYFMAAVALAERLPSFWLAHLAYFAAAGILWAFPARYLIGWMVSAPRKDVP